MSKRNAAPWVALLAAFLGTLLPSCGSDTLPTEPDYSEFAVDSVMHKCGRWFPAPPSQTRGLFDVFFSTIPDRALSEENRKQVEAAGGEAVHEFHVPIIRALFDVADVPDVQRICVGVTDPDQRNLRLIVRTKTATTEDDRAFLRSLGAAIVIEVTSPIRFLTIVIPDASFPALDAWERLSTMEVSLNAACPAEAES